MTELNADGLEVWRGGVNTWECDEMGHLNVRFYVARQMEGLVGLAGAIGMETAFRPHASATLTIRDQHIRFLREARPRAPLHMTVGVLEVGESDARVLQLLVHSLTGEIAASFNTLIEHATCPDERPFPWPARMRERLEGLSVTAPERARPRSLTLDPPSGAASLAEADKRGLIALGAGAIGPLDLDVFGRARAEVFIGRISDGVPAMSAAWRGSSAEERPANVGGAVLEYRIVHAAHPRAGDRFVIRTGLAGVDSRVQRIAHWVLDPATGRPWATAEAVAIALDLDARRAIPISEVDQARLRERISPGLSL